ncbi:MAG: hypothetical protein JJE36_04755 [Coriobacteriia bacterium]|nr:hypothetical protein [Coriobacteriia bacterium]
MEGNTDKDEIIFSATDPLGRDAILLNSTVEAKRFAHMDASGLSIAETEECITHPSQIHVTAKVEEYPNRKIYYKIDKPMLGRPPIRRVVVDHTQNPGIVVSWMRGSKLSKYDSIEYREAGA